MNDEWRLRVVLEEPDSARHLTDQLDAYDLAHDLVSSFHDRVIVSRDGAEVFCYTAKREQADAVETLIRSLAAEHGWRLQSELRRWHPVAAEWKEPDEPLPASADQRAAERTELMARERQESRDQGYPEYEVRVQCASQTDAVKLAENLRAEGFACIQRWQFVVLGAPDEDTANALAERVRLEAPSGSTVTAEGSVTEVVAEAPYATPLTSGPFAVFGGLSG